MPKYLKALLLTDLLILSGCGMPHMYNSKEVYGWVVDSDTLAPIQNVIVLISWGLKGGWHTDHMGYLIIEETRTDDNGYYYFEPWGPEFTTYELRSYDPVIYFLKIGYLPTGLMNESVASYSSPWTNSSDWTGKTIALHLYNETSMRMSKYASALNGYINVLRLTSGRQELRCVWEEVPRFTATLIDFGNMFKKKGINSSLPDLDMLIRNECNDPQDILGEYLDNK